MKVNYPEIDLIQQTLTLLCAQWWISTFMVTLAVPSFHCGNDLDMNNLHRVFFHFTPSFARWFGHILKLFRVGEKNPILSRSKFSSDGTLSCSSFKNSMFPITFFYQSEIRSDSCLDGEKAENSHVMIENAEKNCICFSMHSWDVSCLPFLREGILFLNQKSSTKGVIFLLVK